MAGPRTAANGPARGPPNHRPRWTGDPREPIRNPLPCRRADRHRRTRSHQRRHHPRTHRRGAGAGTLPGPRRAAIHRSLLRRPQPPDGRGQSQTSAVSRGRGSSPQPERYRAGDLSAARAQSAAPLRRLPASRSAARNDAHVSCRGGPAPPRPIRHRHTARLRFPQVHRHRGERFPRWHRRAARGDFRSRIRLLRAHRRGGSPSDRPPGGDSNRQGDRCRAVRRFSCQRRRGLAGGNRGPPPNREPADPRHRRKLHRRHDFQPADQRAGLQRGLHPRLRHLRQ